MKKKTYIKEEDVTIIVKKNKPSLYSIWLTPSDWKQLFTKEEYYLLVIECLNSSVTEDEMILNGYLLTYNSLCLILGNEKESHKKTLLRFFERIKKAIAKHRKKVSNKEDSIIKLSAHHIFRKHNLNNSVLIKLLVGKKVNLPYYDAQLAQLENKLQHEPFCSVIDYSGAIGPVIITKLENETTFTIIDIEMVSIENEYLIN